jgi:hypothetical protein
MLNFLSELTLTSQILQNNTLLSIEKILGPYKLTKVWSRFDKFCLTLGIFKHDKYDSSRSNAHATRK